jgi:hypothetical protein
MRPMLSSAVLIGSGSASERPDRSRTAQHIPCPHGQRHEQRTCESACNGSRWTRLDLRFIRVSRSRRTAAMLSTLNVIASVRKMSKAGVGVCRGWSGWRPVRIETVMVR